MSSKKSILYPPQPNTSRGGCTKLGANKGKISYANGKSAIIRDLNDPAQSVAYTDHVHATTVARISPSGYYCASADVSGSVRIWDTVGEDHATKNEFKVIGGKINDLEWDGESKRIIAVGDGREKFGHAFMTDSGSSTGEISGHSKAVNAVSIRHQRPFRAATAADDGTIVFHTGAPYKYDKTIKSHTPTKFVTDVRYSPSGDLFASVGSDSRAFVYDGKTGDVLGEFSGDGHKGTITACSWSYDNKNLVTSGLDCVVKFWDVETRQSVSTFSMGSGVDFQQVGITYSEESTIVSLATSGALNVFDSRIQGVTRVIQGPLKAVTAATLTEPSTFLAGTADGRVFEYDSSSHDVYLIKGDAHSALVSGLASAQGKAVSVGFDDKIKEIESSSFVPSVASTSSQPKAVALGSDGFAFVAGVSTIEVFKSSQKIYEIKPSFAPSAIAVSGNVVAVGGEDGIVRLYSWQGQTLETIGQLEGNKGTVSALAFTPDGSFMASGDSAGKIILFDIHEKIAKTTRWAYHSARVNSLAFTVDGQHCASGSLDTHVYVWSVARPLKSIAIKNAGPGGVNNVFWIGSGDSKLGKLASTGADACVRVWDVTFHA